MVDYFFLRGGCGGIWAHVHQLGTPDDSALVFYPWLRDFQSLADSWGKRHQSPPCQSEERLGARGGENTFLSFSIHICSAEKAQSLETIRKVPTDPICQRPRPRNRGLAGNLHKAWSLTSFLAIIHQLTTNLERAQPSVPSTNHD